MLTNKMIQQLTKNCLFCVCYFHDHQNTIMIGQHHLDILGPTLLARDRSQGTSDGWSNVVKGLVVVVTVIMMMIYI